jgi:hypothetical protein
VQCGVVLLHKIPVYGVEYYCRSRPRSHI